MHQKFNEFQIDRTTQINLKHTKTLQLINNTKIEANGLSTINRSESDRKVAEAEAIAKQIEILKQ